MKNVQMLRAKTYHMADKANQVGGVSALCFKTPRAIDLSRALWTNRPEAVTCPKCRAMLKQGRHGARFGGLAVDCLGPNSAGNRGVTGASDAKD